MKFAIGDLVQLKNCDMDGIEPGNYKVEENDIWLHDEHEYLLVRQDSTKPRDEYVSHSYLDKTGYWANSGHQVVRI